MIEINLQFFGGRGGSGGKGSSGGGVSGGGGTVNSAMKDTNKARAAEREIRKLEKERKSLVERFSKAEDSNNEKKMDSLRNLIAANDRERKNAEKRYRLYRYGETS